jgi:hypothetical protein
MEEGRWVMVKDEKDELAELENEWAELSKPATQQQHALEQAVGELSQAVRR